MKYFSVWYIAEYTLKINHYVAATSSEASTGEAKGLLTQLRALLETRTNKDTYKSKCCCGMRLFCLIIVYQQYNTIKLRASIPNLILSLAIAIHLHVLKVYSMVYAYGTWWQRMKLPKTMIKTCLTVEYVLTRLY